MTKTKGNYVHLPIIELETLCRTRGLQFGGEKAILVARLEEFDRAEDAPGPLNSTTGQVGAHIQIGKKQTEQSQCHLIPTDKLTDDALLSIFDFYMVYMEDIFQPTYKKIEAWQTLVHVCRRWRCIVFGYPRHLNLRLACFGRRPVTDMLDVWPTLPVVVIHSYDYQLLYPTPGFDNIIAALKHNDRICDITLDLSSSSQLEKVADAMRQPFPVLTILKVQLLNQWAQVVLPDSFMGGSAPCLQKLVSEGIPFQDLPKLLLSTTRLSTLSLLDIPHSGYISPDVMVTHLSTLTNLEHLCLGFSSPSSCPNHAYQHYPLPTRTVLPALTSLEFTGFSIYLEDFVAQIDAPLLDSFSLAFLDELAFDTPQVIQFISHTPKLKAPKHAKLIFHDFHLRFTLPLPSPNVDEEDYEKSYGASIRLRYEQISSLVQARSSSLFPLSTVKCLVMREADDRGIGGGVDSNIQELRWLLYPFTAVETLYLSEELEPHIGPALPDLQGEIMTEILPALRDIVYHWR